MICNSYLVVLIFISYLILFILNEFSGFLELLMLVYFKVRVFL